MPGYPNWFKLIGKSITCSKIDHNIDEEYSVGYAVEDDPSDGEVVVEEGNCHRKNDQICHQQQEHTEVPVEPGNS